MPVIPLESEIYSIFKWKNIIYIHCSITTVRIGGGAKYV